MGDETKPDQQFVQTADEHGTQLGRLQIDKTTTLQNFIDLIGNYVAHPNRPKEEKLKQTQFMIPYNESAELTIGRTLLDDMCDITRKDLEVIQDVAIEDPRQRARKEFNHPKDTVMSMIYCMVADQNYDEGKNVILGVGRKKRG